MKKYLIFGLMAVCFLLVGCGNKITRNVKQDLINQINSLTAYQLDGKLEVVNNDDVFNYNVVVSYKDKDFYRVSLKNIANNHEQIILRNEDGVYVKAHQSFIFC